MNHTPESTGSIQFVMGDSTEVLRISKDGITVNPDVPVDEITQTVLKALDKNIQVLVQRAVEATILCNKVAQWMIERSYATGHGDTIEGLLEALVQSVREEERELCAQVCDEIANKPSNMVLGVALDCADAIRTRGEKPWVKTYAGGKPNYTAPRQWQGLTDDERNQFRQWAHPEIIDAIELKLRERNP